MTDTQAIKDRIDIVQLISEYVPLKKAGTNYKARCPFHNEKSPSFVVAKDRQMWHCFGCGKGGDAFSFIQEMEGLDFVGALKLLAERAGVKIESYQSEINTSDRNRALQVLDAAAHFYHQFLLEIPGSQIARDYLNKRALSPATINEWLIGYSSEQWDLLTKYLIKKGFGINDLVASGLTIMRDGADAKTLRGYYDRFRGRIMFPITDAHGSVVGFTGRLIKENAEAGGKYVNSPQTIVYDKSKVLFGLSKAKSEIKAKNLAVVVEGQMDVIACHQAGMKNVVAASGTALTPDQVRLLKRYSENLAVAFDADAAGEKAGQRGIDVALAEGINAKVIQLDPAIGKDADEAIKKNPAAWFSAVENAQTVMDWYFARAFLKADLTNPKNKREIADLLLYRISLIPYAIDKEHWLKKLADLLMLDLAVLRAELKKVKPLREPLTNKKEEIMPDTKIVENFNDPLYNLQTEWWSLILKYPKLFPKFADKLRAEYFFGTPLEMLYEKAKNLYTSIGVVDVEALRQSYSGSGQNYVDVLLLRPVTKTDLTESTAAPEAEQLLDRIKDQYKKKRGKELEREIAAAEATGNQDLVKTLIQELQLL